MRWTLIFLKTPHGWLLQKRRHPPYQGKWNALGGKLYPDEAPKVGASRELQEESHVILAPSQLKEVGVIHWYVDGQFLGDLFAFVGEHDVDLAPQQTREGRLQTFETGWIMATDAPVVPDLPSLLQAIMDGCSHEFKSEFRGEKLLRLTALA